MRGRMLVGLMGAVVVGAAACGAPASPTSAPPSASPASPSLPSPPTPGPTSSPAPTSASPPADGVLVIDGTVRRGASPSCWVLNADDGRSFVVEDTQNPPANVAVQVRGVPAPDELSHCNAGTVLHVQRIDVR